MAFISAPTSSFLAPAIGGVSFARLRTAFRRAFLRAQIGRMTSVLSMLPDAQLHNIGITRSEIADYAEMLMLPSAQK